MGKKILYEHLDQDWKIEKAGGLTMSTLSKCSSCRKEILIEDRYLSPNGTWLECGACGESLYVRQPAVEVYSMKRTYRASSMGVAIPISEGSGEAKKETPPIKDEEAGDFIVMDSLGNHVSSPPSHLNTAKETVALPNEKLKKNSPASGGIHKSVARLVQFTVGVLVFGTVFLGVDYLGDSLEDDATYVLNKKIIRDPSEIKYVTQKDQVERMQSSTLRNDSALDYGDNENKNKKAQVETLMIDKMIDSIYQKTLKMQEPPHSAIKEKETKERVESANNRPTQAQLLWVTAQVLNFRSAPFQGAKVVDQVEKGTELKVLGKYRDWLWVQNRSLNKGWVHSDYVSESHPE